MLKFALIGGAAGLHLARAPRRVRTDLKADDNDAYKNEDKALFEKDDDDDSEAFDPYTLSEDDWLCAKYPLEWEADASMDSKPLIDLSARDKPIPEFTALVFDVDTNDTSAVAAITLVLGDDAVPLIKRCPSLLRRDVAKPIAFISDNFGGPAQTALFALTIPALLAFDVDQLQSALDFLEDSLGPSIRGRTTPELLFFAVTETIRTRRIAAALDDAQQSQDRLKANLAGGLSSQKTPL